MTQPNERVILTTRRLLLRPAYKQDAVSLYAAFSDPEVMRYWDSTPHSTTADTDRWVDKMIASPANGTTDFIICRISSPSSTPAARVSSDDDDDDDSSPSSPVIGKIGVWNTERSEIGFLLARRYWRQGLVSEALSMLLPYFFERKGFEKITADIDPRNEASRALLEKFGFVVVGRREKTFNIAGEWVDSLDLLLRKDDFMRRRAAGAGAAGRDVANRAKK